MRRVGTVLACARIFGGVIGQGSVGSLPRERSRIRRMFLAIHCAAPLTMGHCHTRNHRLDIASLKLRSRA